MKHLFYLLLLLLQCLFSVYSNGQSKLILTSALERKVIHHGKIIGITLKGEKFKFTNWKSVFDPYMPLPDLWNFEKAEGKKMFLSGFRYIDSSYKDTIFKEDRYLLKNKNYVVDTIIKNKNGDHRYDKWICTISKLYEQEMLWKVINYDSIESLTFAHLNMEKYKYPRLGYYGLADFLSQPITIGSNGGGCGIFALPIYYLIDGLIILPLNLIINGIDHINGDVKTYYLNEWKVTVK